MCSWVDTSAAPLSPAGAATLRRLGSASIAAAIAVVTVWVQLYYPGHVGGLARLQELGQRTWARLAPYPVLVWPMAIGSAVYLLRPDRFGLAALGWLAADLSLIALQKFYFEHYFIQVFASAVLVGAIGAAWVLQSRPSDGRANLAGNFGGEGLPSAVADNPGTADDPRALLGMTSQSGAWSTDGHSATTLTVQLGVDAVADRVIVRDSFYGSPAGEGLQLLAAAGADFDPLAGSWERDDGAWTYRFAPRSISAVRLVTAAGASTALRLERLEASAVGMGIAVRYRTGPNPDLNGTPWIVPRDEDAPQVISAQQYVQVQCEMWSRFAGHGLALRCVQIGQRHFQLDAQPANAPVRTANRLLTPVPHA